MESLIEKMQKFVYWDNEDHEDPVAEVLALIENFKKEELTSFLDFLLKEGYCDSDVYDEPPTAIDRYLFNLR